VSVQIFDVALVEIDFLDGSRDVTEGEHAELLPAIHESLYFF
jgi:hypothetical protein